MRAEVIQGSDWTILQEGTVLSSTDDDVITMEMLVNCSIQQGNTVNHKAQTGGQACEGSGGCQQACFQSQSSLQQFTSN